MTLGSRQDVSEENGMKTSSEESDGLERNFNVLAESLK